MPGPDRRDLAHGLTLIELLIVMGLAATLLAAAISGYSMLTRTTAVTLAGRQLVQDLEEARDAASARSLAVEIRFYALAVAPGGGVDYSAWQARAVNADGTVTALAPLRALPPEVVLDSAADRSTLLGSAAPRPGADPADRHLDAATRCFRFLPDGSTDLDPAARWFLTLRPAGVAPPRAAANWACIQVDPATGRVALFRP